CPASNSINDDVALELHLKAPTNATGFKFKFKFYSFEYAEWVCNNFNDQFIALMNPAPQGSLNGNISFDANNNPVSVNIAFFDVCNAANIGDFAQNCNNGGGTTCPTAPSPYCPNGTTELQGTGFENDGATSWLQTTAPVTPGQEFTLRLAIWDTGDSAYDSTVLIDDFEWIATGSVNVGTVSCTSGGTGSCNTCFYQNVQSTGCCGNEFSACHNDGQCENIYTCLSFCNGNAACEAQCPNDFPAGVPLYNAVTHCLYGDPAVQGSVGACGAVCQ
ncbi:MAG: choice-of-anchor L domain-containing protein, partial [Polyangiaceae bacterium]